jgi:hypothetical protein
MTIKSTIAIAAVAVSVASSATTALASAYAALNPGWSRP